jgi:prefoldin subunit 5
MSDEVEAMEKLTVEISWLRANIETIDSTLREVLSELEQLRKALEKSAAEHADES